MPKCARCGKRWVPNEGELCWECQLEAWKEEVRLWEKEIEEIERELEDSPWVLEKGNKNGD